MAFNGLTPAQYVEFLTSPGIRTVAGAVPLSAYVSTSPSRFTRAVAVQTFFNQLLAGFSNSTADYTVTTRRPPRPYPGSRLFADPVVAGGRVADGLNHLEMMYQAIVSHGGPARPSNWRRVFTGQGLPGDIAEVMNFIVVYGDVLRAVTARGGTSPFGPYLSCPPLAGLRAMVTDQIFGMDCLGFVGTYLVFCGMQPRYPECTQAQYAGLGFRGVDTLDEIDGRCVVLWLDRIPTLHIGIIDSVTSRSSQVITVNLCQSSRGGPQVNAGVRLAATPEQYVGPFGTCRRFQLSGPSPVVGVVEVGKRASW